MEDYSTLVVAAGGVLAAAIGALFKIILKQNDQTSKLSGRVGRLEGEHKGIRELSEKTLEVVHSALRDRDADD